MLSDSLHGSAVCVIAIHGQGTSRSVAMPRNQPLVRPDESNRVLAEFEPQAAITKLKRIVDLDSYQYVMHECDSKSQPVVTHG